MIAACLAIAALAALLAYRERVHSKERADLLDRIQAPEVVVQRQVLESVEHDPEPVPVDMGPWSLPEKEEED